MTDGMAIYLQLQFVNNVLPAPASYLVSLCQSKISGIRLTKQLRLTIAQWMCPRCASCQGTRMIQSSAKLCNFCMSSCTIARRSDCKASSVQQVYHPKHAMSGFRFGSRVQWGGTVRFDVLPFTIGTRLRRSTRRTVCASHWLLHSVGVRQVVVEDNLGFV